MEPCSDALMPVAGNYTSFDTSSVLFESMNGKKIMLVFSVSLVGLVSACQLL